MLEAAIYFEAREDTIDKSVLLYQRAGNLPKAIELAFKVRNSNGLLTIVSDLRYGLKDF